MTGLLDRMCDPNWTPDDPAFRAMVKAVADETHLRGRATVVMDWESRALQRVLLGDPSAPLGGGLLGPAPRPPVPPGRVTRQQRRAAERAGK